MGADVTNATNLHNRPGTDSRNGYATYQTRWTERLWRRTRVYLLLAPAMGILLTLVIYPLFFSLSKSFSSFNLVMPTEEFVGFKNYARALSDPNFRASLMFTILFAVVATGFELILGFTAALLLRRNFIGKRLVSIILIMPMMITPVVVGIIWLLMFQPGFSVINGLLAQIGIDGPIWLQNPWTARIAVIVADIWQWTPFFILILLSGLLNLPVEVLEAAEVDGASARQKLYYITLPMMRPFIMVALLIRLIDSFKMFDVAFIMTNGGPVSATETLSLYIYRTGIPFLDMGYASAMSYLFLILLSIASTILIRQLRKTNITT